MPATNPSDRFSLQLIAVTGAQFANFAPFVPAVNEGGDVAFQATLRSGVSGVYRSREGSIAALAESGDGPIREVRSHPDLSGDGSVCFYATLASGASGVFLVRRGEVVHIADAAGPLGPTMNEAGELAFRVHAADTQSIFTTSNGRTTRIAMTGELLSGFQGLPVINRRGDVAFRADLRDGTRGIYANAHGHETTVIQTGGRFSDLGNFPTINDSGEVAFVAAPRAGGSGLFLASDGRIEALLDSSGPFENFRGVLLNNAGGAVFYATPRGGTLGIFTGPDPVADRLLAIGSPFMGSTITDFALNPVSMNDAGQLAIRIALADSRQMILRADPAR